MASKWQQLQYGDAATTAVVDKPKSKWQSLQYDEPALPLVDKIKTKASELYNKAKENLPSVPDIVQYAPSKAWQTAKNVMALGTGDIGTPTWDNIQGMVERGEITPEAAESKFGFLKKEEKPLIPITETIDENLQPPSTAGKIGKGLLKGVGKVAEGLTTQGGLTGLAAAYAVPGAGLGFIPDMAVGSYEKLIGSIRDAYNKRFPEAAENLGESAALGIGTPIAGKLFRPKKAPIKEQAPEPTAVPEAMAPKPVEPPPVVPADLPQRVKAFEERMAPKVETSQVEPKGLTLYDERGEPVLVQNGKVYKEITPQKPDIQVPTVLSPKIDIPAPAPKPQVVEPITPQLRVREFTPELAEAKKGAYVTDPEPYVGTLDNAVGPQASAKGFKKSLLRKSPERLALEAKAKDYEVKARESVQKIVEDIKRKDLEAKEAARQATFPQPKVVNPSPTLYDARGNKVGIEHRAESIKIEEPEAKIQPQLETVTPKTTTSQFTDLGRVAHPLSAYVGNKASMLRAGAYDGTIDTVKQYNNFIEPFGGSGLLGNALTSKMKYKIRVLNDLDTDVVNYHNVVKSRPNEIINKLTEYDDQIKNIQDQFPDAGQEAKDIITKWWKDKESTFNDPNGDPIEKAAFFQLRNSGGTGHYGKREGIIGKGGSHWKIKKNTITSRITEIKSHSKGLQNTEITNLDAAELLNKAKNGDFVAVDPPYVQQEGKLTKVADYKEGKDLTTIDGAVGLIKGPMAYAIKRGANIVYTNNAHPDIVEALQSVGLKVKFAIVGSATKEGVRGTRKEVIGYSEPSSAEIAGRRPDTIRSIQEPVRPVGQNLFKRGAGELAGGLKGSNEAVPTSSRLGSSLLKATPTKEANLKAPEGTPKIDAKATPYTLVDKSGKPLKSVKTVDEAVDTLEGRETMPKIGATLLRKGPKDLKATIDPDFDREHLKIETRTTPEGKSVIYDATTKAPTNIIADTPREAMDIAAEKFKRSLFKETFTPKLSQRVSLDTVKAGIEKGLEDLPEVQKVHLKEQAQLAHELLTNDFEYARRVINGQEPLMGKLEKVNLWKAMKEVAEKTNDIDLMKELATSPVTTEVTKAAQMLSSLQDIDKNDPVSIMADIVKARKEKLAEKHGSIEKALENDIKKYEIVKAKSQPKIKDVVSLIEMLKCK